MSQSHHMKRIHLLLLLFALISYQANAFAARGSQQDGTSAERKPNTDANRGQESPSKASDQSGPLEIKLMHDALGKAPTINVRIGDKTYPFLFDTGGGITIISPDVAREIGCASFGRLTAFNAGGTRIDLKRCDGVELKLGAYSTRVDAGVLEVMNFFGPDTPQIGGFVSLHTFEEQAITIDLTNNRISLETEQSLAERVKGMSALESRLSRQSGGASIDIFVAANTPRGKIWLEVDTGNFGALQFSPHAQEQLGINFLAPNKAKMTKPVKLDVAGLGIIEMPARERDMIYDGMLNYDTLSKMLFTIDLRTGRMWAKLNRQP